MDRDLINLFHETQKITKAGSYELREHAMKLLPWNDEMQDRFLAEDPFAHKLYTAKSKAVW